MKRGDRGTRILSGLAVIILAAILVITLRLLFYGREYLSDRKSYELLKERVRADATEEGSGSRIDLDKLKLINPDAAGWLYACNGDIDGPVAKALDDDFYLTHRFDGTEGKAGAFFTDKESVPPFDCPLTVIYGHNMKDGSMFHPLLKYRDKEYYKSCPEFKIYCFDGEKKYRIVSAFYTDIGSIPGVGDGEEDTGVIMEKARELSLYDTDSSEIPENGKIVILVTCEYSGEDNRMAVYGIEAGG